MTSLYVLGAGRSGASLLAFSEAKRQGLPLCADLAEARTRIAAGERLVALATDETPDCPALSAAPRLLSERSDLRVAVVWRHGVDFVNSRLRARPGASFVDHCRLWASAQEKAQQLQRWFPSAVELIEFQTLLADVPADPTPQRTSLLPRRPVQAADRTSWSIGEVEAFARLCGQAMRGLGATVDLPAARRRRPLDLGRMLHERAYRFGLVELEPSRSPGTPWTATAAAGATGRAQLRLSAVAADGRASLRLEARAAAPSSCRLSCEVVEALTRRPLFAARQAEGDPGLKIAARLPANDGLVEMALAFSKIPPDARVEFAFARAELAYG